MDEDLIAALRAAAGLAAIVGDRIGWDERDAEPSITLQLVAGAHPYTMAGRGRVRGDLVQADLWARSQAERKALREAFVGALDQLGAPFQGVFIEAAREGREPGIAPRPDGSTDFFRASLDLRVWHSPAA